LEDLSLEGGNLFCRLLCIDRTGLTKPLDFQVSNSLFDARVLGAQVDPTEWQIGALIAISRPSEGIPVGVYAVSLVSSEITIPLGQVSTNAQVRLPSEWQTWFFRRGAERLSLLDAFNTDSGVGLTGETVSFACHRFPTPSDVVGLEGAFHVRAGEPAAISLEIRDSYPTIGNQGSVEQRVYANDVLISNHDVAGDFLVGWYGVDTSIVCKSDSLLLRVEVVPLRILGAYGWYKATRTSVRNVQISQ